MGKSDKSSEYGKLFKKLIILINNGKSDSKEANNIRVELQKDIQDAGK